jgi:hypothetical protein
MCRAGSYNFYVALASSVEIGGSLHTSLRMSALLLTIHILDYIWLFINVIF